MPISLWFVPEAGALWCATKNDAAIVGHLEGDPRCSFEVAGDAPPYRGVRGQGRASLHPDKGRDVLNRLLLRYAIESDSHLARSLMAQADREVAICVSVEWLISWDFTKRMSGAMRD